MLVYLLAIASGSGSLALFLTAFFLPEIHRKGDFIWSGIGLFYALVLWIMASKVGGGLLLGETAGVAILVWAISQVLQTRWKLVPPEQRSAPSVELVAKIEQLFSEESLQKIQTKVTELAGKVKLPEMGQVKTPKAKVGTEASPTVAPTPTPEVSSEASPAAIPAPSPEVTVEVIPDVAPATTPTDAKPAIDTEAEKSQPEVTAAPESAVSEPPSDTPTAE